MEEQWGKGEEAEMRRLTILSIMTLLLLGVMAGPGLASGPAIIFQGTDVVEDALNPCTGGLEDVFFEARVVIHEVESDDSHHLVFSAQGTATQGDFSGPVVTRFVDNGQGSLEDPEETQGMFSFVSHVVMRNPQTGQVINNHFLFHLTLAGGESQADFDIVSLECRGRPAT